jgi:uncharacterized protein YndB with AHSA1/START domain
MAEKNADTSDREIVVTRVFDAPLALVWRAWTEPEHLAVWWGPRGFTTTTRQMDLRSGGVWRFVMHGPDRDYPNKVVYEEVVVHERIVFRHVGDEAGVEDSTHRSIITFTARGPLKTEVTMRGIFESAAELRRIDKKYGAIEGAEQNMDRCGEYLATMKP